MLVQAQPADQRLRNLEKQVKQQAGTCSHVPMGAHDSEKKRYHLSLSELPMPSCSTS